MTGSRHINVISQFFYNMVPLNNPTFTLTFKYYPPLNIKPTQEGIVTPNDKTKNLTVSADLLRCLAASSSPATDDSPPLSLTDRFL